MVNTKYNFKKYLREKYPDIVASAVYGIPAYILSKDLSGDDTFLYSTQQLPSGKYVAFVGATPEQVADWMKSLKKGTLLTTQYSLRNTCAPTTFSAFRLWVERHEKPVINRTYCHKTSPHNILHTDQINNCEAVDAVGNWYMFEFLSDPEDAKTFIKVPWVQVEGTTIVLIKASPTNYVSKKTLFSQLIMRLEPLFTKIMKACAEASVFEQTDKDKAAQKWEDAKNFANEYMMLQFEYYGTVDVEKLKEAYNEDMLSIFLRDKREYRPLTEEVSTDKSDF